MLQMLEIAGAIFAALLAAAGGLAHAQSYPGKPIRIVVPNAPGGGSDSAARAVANRLAPVLGQQILVENRPGAGGRLAAEFVAKATPDGYTLLLGTGATLIMAKALYRKLHYDPLTSFAPISLIGTTAYLLVTHPSVPAATVRQLITVAKSSRDHLSYASTGSGSPSHLAAELFGSLAGITLVHVPYKGSAPGTLSVMQGETDMMFSNLVAALPHIGSGRLRSLGVTSARRSVMVPNIPTIAESGLPGFEVVQYYSVVAPAGTPATIVSRLNKEIARQMPAPEVRKVLQAQGTEVAVSTADDLSRLIAAEIEKWAAVIRNAGIKPD